jgi:hypothetical protein
MKLDILERDADKPLPEETARQMNCNTSDRASCKKILMRALEQQYPMMDFPMRQTLVEHYLDNPNDEPEEVVKRAPKNYFDESKATINPPQYPSLPLVAQEGDIFSLENNNSTTINEDGEQPPGGRGILIGDRSSQGEGESEEGTTTTEGEIAASETLGA